MRWLVAPLTAGASPVLGLPLLLLLLVVDGRT